MLIKIWQFLTSIETILSLLAMVFAFYASFKFWKWRRELKALAEKAPKIENFKENVEFHKGIKTINPIALAISLVPQTPSIKKAVEIFLKSNNLKMKVEELNMNGIKNPEDIEEFIHTLTKKRHLFEHQGVTEVHLFIQGPVMAGVLVGAMLDNWKPVKLYHKPTPAPPAIYEYWCPLTK